MNKRLYGFLGFIVVLSFAGCQPVSKPKEKRSEARPLMGTVIQLDACYEPGEEGRLNEAYVKAWERLDDIGWRMNVFDAKSDLSRINTAKPGESVEVGEDTYQLLERSVQFYHITRKAFDITVLPLINLWKSAALENHEPEPAEIQRLVAQLGPGNLIFLEDNKVARRNEVVQVDLGGIAKGYASDEVARIFRDHGFENFYIAVAGDVYVGGLNCAGDLWRIGIRDPRDKSQIFEVLHLTNQAVSTSGNYERFLTINGETYSHIIDPVTGYPQKEVVSASVVAPSSERADALATAVTVLRYEAGLSLIEEVGDDYGVLILEKADNSATMKRYQSETLLNYIK